MNGGMNIMEVVKTTLNADLLAPIIKLPASLLGKNVEVTIKESEDNIVDEMYGIASELNMSLEEIRNERLDNK